MRQKSLNQRLKFIFEILVFCGFVMIALFFIAHHEPWRDEAQAWLLSRDLSLTGLISQMKYEGHPALWGLLIFPFTKLGLPYICINFLSFGLMSVAAFLIMFKSPFNIIVKTALLMNCSFFYSYPVIARNYSLVPPILFLIACIFREKREKYILFGVLVGLLANTHVLMASVSGLLLFIYFVDEIFIPYIKHEETNYKNAFISIIIGGLGIILMIAQLLGGEYTGGTGIAKQGLMAGLLNSCSFIFRWFTGYVNMGNIPLYTIGLVIIISLLCVSYWRSTLIFTISVTFQLTVYYVLDMFVNRQRAELIYFIAIFCVWLVYETKPLGKTSGKWQKLLLNSALIIVVIFSFRVARDICVREIREEYSAAKSTSIFINDKFNDENTVFVALNDSSASAILPFTDKKEFYNPTIRDFYTYVTWTSARMEQINEQELKSRVDADLSDYENIYVILSSAENSTDKAEIDFDNLSWLEKVYTSSPSIDNYESYTIYQYTK